MESVRIHRAILADLDDLLPMFSAYRAFYEQEPDAAGEHRYLHERLNNRDSIIFIAKDGAQSLGFAQLFQTCSTVHLAPSFILEDLFVKPGARHHGIGHALLERAKQQAIQSDASGMFLETAHTNRAARRVYEDAGWTLESHFRKYNCPLPVRAS